MPTWPPTPSPTWQPDTAKPSNAGGGPVAALTASLAVFFHALPLEALFVAGYLAVLGAAVLFLGRREQWRWSGTRHVNGGSISTPQPPAVASGLPTALLGLASVVLRYPYAVVASALLLGGGLGGAAWRRRPVAFDVDFEAYLTSDGPASENYAQLRAATNDATVCVDLQAAVDAATTARRLLHSKAGDIHNASSGAQRSASSPYSEQRFPPRRLAGASEQQLVRLIYSSWDPLARPRNVLTDARLRAMRRAEAAVACAPSYQAFCARTTSGSGGDGPCDPMLSLAPAFHADTAEGGVSPAFGPSSNNGGDDGACARPSGSSVGEYDLVAPLEDAVAVAARRGLGAGYVATTFTAGARARGREQRTQT